MFNKLSSKLRNRGGSGDGQKGKNCSYGKVHKKTGSLPVTAAPETLSEIFKEEDEADENENARLSNFSFAESLFPTPSGKAHRVIPKAASVPESELIGGGGHSYSSGSSSFGEERGSKFSWEPHSSAGQESLSSASAGQESSAGQEELSTVGQEELSSINIGSAVLKDYEDAEEDFLGEFDDYYENLSVDNIRKEQYPKLDVQRLVYLDYASCGLFSAYQIHEHMRVLLEEGPYLGLAETNFDPSNHVPDAQDRLFRLLNTDRSSYSVVFTTSFAAGFRLMGKAFPFQKNTPVLVSQDNHVSVRTLISSAVEKGAKPTLAPITESDLGLDGSQLRKILRRRQGTDGLFVFPAQSCASGVVHSLNWVAEAQQNGWQVLIDASTFLPTGRLDLSTYQPEFVLGSIAHLLGYPSGFGFLLVKKGAYKVHSNGFNNDVRFVKASPTNGWIEDRDCLIVDEDNILNALAFAGVASGLTHVDHVGYEAILKRVRSLTAWLVQTLLSLKHKEPRSLPLARVYGPQSTRSRGNVVTFSVLDSTGSTFLPEMVVRLAEKQNILISGGDLSCPGVTNLLANGVDKVKDVSVFERKPAKFALIRASLGPVTTFRDVYRFAEFLSKFRDEDYVSSEAIGFFEDPEGV